MAQPSFLWTRAGTTFVAVSSGQRAPSPAAGTHNPEKLGTSVGFHRLWPCIELVRRALVTRTVTRRTSKKDQEGRRHREISRIYENLGTTCHAQHARPDNQAQAAQVIEYSQHGHGDVWAFCASFPPIQRLRRNIQNGHVRPDGDTAFFLFENGAPCTASSRRVAEQATRKMMESFWWWSLAGL